MTASSDPFGPDGHVDLAGFVRGDLTTGATLDAADHLTGCSSCRDDLVEVIAGHAVLTRARRTERGTYSRVDGVELPPPVAPAPQPAASPWRRVRRPRVVVGAALAVLVAAVGVALAVRLDDDPPAAPTRSLTLAPLAKGGPAEVRMTTQGGRTEMTLRAGDLPETRAGRYYEAWLLRPGTDKMLSLGPLSGETSRFRVDDDLLAVYSAIDVSLEADDGNPAHSAVSVLRGAY